MTFQTPEKNANDTLDIFALDWKRARTAMDNRGMIWVSFTDGSGGLYKYNPYENRTSDMGAFVPPPSGAIRSLGFGPNITSKMIFLTDDAKGNVWISTVNHLLLYFPEKDTVELMYYDSTSSFQHPTPFGKDHLLFAKFDLKNSKTTVLFLDKNTRETTLFYDKFYSGKGWRIDFPGRDKQVLELHSIHGFRQRNMEDGAVTKTWFQWSDEIPFNYAEVKNVIQLNNGDIWVSCESEVFVFSENSEAPKQLSLQAGNHFHISSPQINAVNEDANGNLWLATSNGIRMLPPSPHSILHYKDSFLVRRLERSYTGGHTICNLNNREVMIGNEHGLALYDKETKTVHRNWEKFPNITPLVNQNIIDLYLDQHQILWISLYDLTEGYFKVFFYDMQADQLAPLTSLEGTEAFRKKSSKCGFAFEDEKSDVYFYANPHAKLFRLNREEERLVPVLYGKQPYFATAFFYDAYRHQLWTYNQSKVRAYDWVSEKLSAGNTPAIEINNTTVNTIFQDAKKRIWLGTNTGLLEYDHSRKTIARHQQRDGLPGAKVNGILEDDHGHLWLSFYEEGIARFNPDIKTITHFSKSEGLGSNRFWLQSCAKDENGYFYFGDDGIAVFHPDSIKTNKVIPPVYITGLEVLNKAVVPGSADSILRQPIYLTSNIELTYNQNVITFQYNALNYLNAEKNQYAYQLEGFDADWQYVGNKREATYTNLSPGTYTFRVKGSNNNNQWNEAGTSLKITVHPPWYLTWWAYLGYIMLGLSSLFALYRFQLNRQLEQQEAHRLAELDAFKTQLYTSITHEFRTPLTIILGMAERATEFFDKNDRAGFQQAAHLVRRNGKQLLRLVNQMLDLARLQAKKMDIQWQQDDVVHFLKYLAESFHSMATDKEVSVQQTYEQSVFVMDFDADKLQKIVSNLLSNAIKFSREGGKVTLRSRKEKGHFVIEVEDEGVGIAAKDIPHVFDRFFKSNGVSSHVSGTGIGLALTKELVKLLGGTISVESEPGRGSLFVVHLPIHQWAEQTSKVPLDEMDVTPTVPSTPLRIPAGQQQEFPLILIVEDNEEVTWYLSGCLEDKYQLAHANNGQEGIEKAIALIPDFIISDVMMPLINGYELCHTLKKDQRTSHIPILLLTAKADTQSRISGLQQGADAYLTKPFDKEELFVRIDKLLELRLALRVRYENGIPAAPMPGTTETIIEYAFLTQLREIIVQRLDDPALDVTYICKQIGMSRTQLHRKITALTGHSTTRFVRSVRYQKAKGLLHQSELTIAEIAYQVGFSDPAYFSRMFKKETGATPTDFRAEKKL